MTRNTRQARGKVHRQPHGLPQWLRLAVFVVVVGVVAGVVYGLWPREPEAPSAYDQKVTVSMAGFNPGVIDVTAGSGATVWLVNPDSSLHTDGGGVHGFTVPDLDIDVKVQPESTELVTLPLSAAPGEYRFYCDTCCGGKENPAMNGVIRVSA